MRKIVVLQILILLLSCEKQGDFSKNIPNETISSTAILLSEGDFIPTSGINCTGKSKIYRDNNQLKLELSGFSISEGPDLKVYLSKTSLTEEFVSLGNLTTSRVYAISNAINLEEYSYVLIHCQQYNHLFATAKLIQN